MTLPTLIIVNAALGLGLVHALVHLLTHAVHADRRLRVTRAAQVRALPSRHRDRVAA